MFVFKKSKFFIFIGQKCICEVNIFLQTNLVSFELHDFGVCVFPAKRHNKETNCYQNETDLRKQNWDEFIKQVFEKINDRLSMKKDGNFLEMNVVNIIEFERKF